MGGTEVASVVTSIISAFGNGLDVFHRLSGKRRKTKARLPRPAEEEEWLRQSLKERPVEIRREYDQQVVKFGRHFERGDDAAQSNLAHVLLVLNTGLINLINHALSANSKTVSTSQRELYSLSETAAVETMAALVQLGSRLNLSSPSRLALEPKDHRKPGVKQSPKERQSTLSASSKQKERPPPAPLLVRGGWIRGKGGSSVVSGAGAKKARSEPTGRHQRSKSDSVVAKSSSRSQISTTKRHERAEEDRIPVRHQSYEHLRPQRQPSMLIVPADFFSSVDLSMQMPVPQEPPPRPPKIPLHSRPHPFQRRNRPMSTMTFMTTSTKIGEIPEPKILSAAELQSKPMPYTIPPPLEPMEPRKKRGFKFWKREDKRHDIAAF